MRLFGLALLALLAAAPASAQTIGSMAAANHAGENVTVCGRVASVKILPQQDVVLSFDYAYPSQFFSVLILGMDRQKFNGNELTMVGHRMCGSGIVRLVEGRAQMLIKDATKLAPE